MGSKQQEALRDDLQNATFQAALLIDDKTYTKFKEMMEQFAKLLGIKEKTEQLEGRNIFVEKFSYSFLCSPFHFLVFAKPILVLAMVF